MTLPTIPTLPTDNLYKFIAIFGLVLVIFSTYISYDRENTQINKLENNFNETEIIFKEFKNLSETNGITITEATRLLKESNDSIKKNDTVRIKTEEGFQLLKTDVQKEIDDFDKALKHKLNLILYLGIIFIFVGFGMWFFNTQRPLDKIIKNQNK